ncbi:MAG: DUF2853 family protein [Planctomycetota bacterium]
MSQYLESIQRFDADAQASTVDNIVKHLGIALQSQDGQTVAASDQKELDVIRDGFCKKHLELESAEAEKMIGEVMEMLKHDSAKSRVTVYYLLAHKAGKLDKFA